MAFDGYIKQPPAKVVRPPSPGRNRNPGRPGYSPPPRYRGNRPPSFKGGRNNIGRSYGWGPPSTASGPSPQSPYGTAVPATGDLTHGIPRHMQMARWLLPRAMRFHPWIRGMGLAADLYGLLKGRGNGLVPAMPVISEPGGFNETLPGSWKACGAPVGNAIGYTTSKSLCPMLPLGMQAASSTGTYAKGILWIEPEIDVPERFVIHGQVYYDNYFDRPAITPETVTSPGETRVIPGMPGQNPFDPKEDLSKGLPHALAPYAPQAPAPQMGRTTSNGDTVGDPWTRPRPMPVGGHPGKPGDSNPHTPPKKNQKETKARAPAWFVKLAAKAWGLTEAADLADNLFDCLPKSIQKTAPKTGVTSHTAVIGPGHKYTSVVDRAKHVYDNINALDVDCAARKVACNEVADQLMGRFMGTVDEAAIKRMGLKGYGQALRFLDGYYPSKEVKERWKKFLKDNPDLDRLAKSLDCGKAPE